MPVARNEKGGVLLYFNQLPCWLGLMYEYLAAFLENKNEGFGGQGQKTDRF